jgi:hypothetical protein
VPRYVKISNIVAWAVQDVHGTYKNTQDGDRLRADATEVPVKYDFLELLPLWLWLWLWLRCSSGWIVNIPRGCLVFGKLTIFHWGRSRRHRIWAPHKDAFYTLFYSFRCQTVLI